MRRTLQVTLVVAVVLAAVEEQVLAVALAAVEVAEWLQA
jgi:hypothetical protein